MLRPGTQDTLIRRRVNMPTAQSHAELVREVSPRIKAQAFFSARVAEAHILDRLRDVSDRYARGEIGLGEARNALKDFLRAEGYDDPRQAGMRNLASTGRLNLILKQNAAMANAAAEWKRMHDPDAMKVFPYVRYHARGDKRTRGEHAALDGKIFAKDDPFLSTHTPPWEFNCRCWLEEITAQEAGKTPELIQEPTPPEKVKVESESGFSFDPAHAFEKYDFSAIKDPGLREQAKTGVEKILAGENPTSPTGQTNPANVPDPSHGPITQEQTYTDGERKSLEYAIGKIADASKEHLLVFDPEGNLEFSEAGTKRHAGYDTGNISYEGKIVVHNHPKGNFPYFSQKDLDTFHSKHIKTAAVVSRDYVVMVQRDEDKHDQMGIDITNGRDYRHPNIKQEFSDTYRALRRAKTESEYNELRDRLIQLELQYQSDMAQLSGYKITWFKREDAERLLAGKPDQSDGSDGVGAPAGSGGSSGAGGPPKKDFFALLPGLSQKDAEELSRRQKEIADLAETLDAESKTPEMQADLKAEKTREQCKAEARAAVPEKVMQATDDYVESLPDGALDPLYRYTDKDDGKVNAALRGDVPMTPERKAEILAFSDLLENGPKYSGICYRGCSFETVAAAKQFVRKMIDTPAGLRGFTSLSPDFATALYYARKRPGKVIVVIPNSTHGVYWGPHSSQPRDHETTLDYKVYLKGLAFCQRGDTLYVTAEEVLDEARGL